MADRTEAINEWVRLFFLSTLREIMDHIDRGFGKTEQTQTVSQLPQIFCHEPCDDQTHTRRRPTELHGRFQLRLRVKRQQRMTCRAHLLLGLLVPCWPGISNLIHARRSLCSLLCTFTSSPTGTGGYKTGRISCGGYFPFETSRRDHLDAIGCIGTTPGHPS